MGMFLFYFCFCAECGIIKLAMATETTIFCSLGRQYGTVLSLSCLDVYGLNININVFLPHSAPGWLYYFVFYCLGQTIDSWWALHQLSMVRSTAETNNQTRVFCSPCRRMLRYLWTWLCPRGTTIKHYVSLVS